MRYWRIMPTNPRPKEQFDSVWAYDLANNTIAVSWWQLGDVRKVSAEQFDAICIQEYPETSKKPGSRIYIRNALLRFHGVADNSIAKGDTIVACRGRSRIVGVGTVVGPSYYDEKKGLERIGAYPQHRGSHFLPVRWGMRPEFTVPPTIVLPRSAMSGLPSDTFHLLMKAGDGTPG